MWLGDHVNGGGLVELWLKPVYLRNFTQSEEVMSLK